MTRHRPRPTATASASTPTGDPTPSRSDRVPSRSARTVVTDGGRTPEVDSSAESGEAAENGQLAEAATTSYDESSDVDDVTDSTDSTDSTDDAADGPDERIRYRTRPTIKPSLVWIGLTLVVGGIVAAALFQNVLGLEDPELSSILGWVVVFVVAIVVARFLVRIYILTRTQYLVTDDAIRYEFTLWFRRRSRDVPFRQVRGHELDQNRVQRVFGVGTVAVLTGGTNASLGYVEFHNVPNPGRVRSLIRQRTRELAAERR